MSEVSELWTTFPFLLVRTLRFCGSPITSSATSIGPKGQTPSMFLAKQNWPPDGSGICYIRGDIISNGVGEDVVWSLSLRDVRCVFRDDEAELVFVVNVPGLRRHDHRSERPSDAVVWLVEYNRIFWQFEISPWAQHEVEGTSDCAYSAFWGMFSVVKTNA